MPPPTLTPTQRAAGREKAAQAATARAQARARLQAGELDARRSLARASEVRLEVALTATERAAAQAAYPQEPFNTGVGIGEQLVAAAAALRRRPPGHPAGRLGSSAGHHRLGPHGHRPAHR